MARKKSQTSAKFLLVLIVIFVLGIGLVRLGWSVLRLWQEAKYSTDEHFNLVIVSNPTLVISLLTDGRAMVVAIPGETEVTVPGGYGSYQLQSLWQLDQLEGKNGQLFIKTIEFFLGIPVEGYWGIDGEIISMDGEDIDKEDLWQFWSKKLTLIQLGRWRNRRRLTNLSWLDELRLFFRLKSTQKSNIKFKNFYFDLGLDKSERVDESLVYKLEAERIDGVLQDWFYEGQVVIEKKRIAVLNATGIIGLAHSWARIVKNMGGRVINIDSIESAKAGEDDKGCLIYEAGERLSFTAQRLEAVFGCDIVKEEFVGSRADLTVVIYK